MSEKNCKDLAKQNDIDGFLVGGASLKPACKLPSSRNLGDKKIPNNEINSRGYYQLASIIRKGRECWFKAVDRAQYNYHIIRAQCSGPVIRRGRSSIGYRFVKTDIRSVTNMKSAFLHDIFTK